MDVQDHAARRMDDDALAGCIGRALALADPAPPDLVQTARQLFTWRTVDAELSELLRAPPPAD
jgi:hypothetical protein